MIEKTSTGNKKGRMNVTEKNQEGRPLKSIYIAKNKELYTMRIWNNEWGTPRYAHCYIHRTSGKIHTY